MIVRPLIRKGLVFPLIESPLSSPLARRRGGGSEPAAPVNAIAPSISGIAQVGQLLTCNRGAWTGYPSITYTYQWRRGVSNIGGATSDTYTTVEADEGENVDCRVTATNTEGSESANSNALTILAASGAASFDSTTIRFDSDTYTFDEVA